MVIHNKSTIEKWILPHLIIGEQGFETTVLLIEKVECVLHRLKTGSVGCPMSVARITNQTAFSKQILSWQSVFYYFNKWSKNGCWQKIWIDILNSNHQYLNLSSVEFDGSHTLAKNGGDAIGYQRPKA